MSFPRVAKDASIAAFFARVPDPRCARIHKHALVEVLTLALCAVLCGADDFTDIARFARAKEDWFRRRLGLCLRHGTPSHDTFSRLLARIDSDVFAACFAAWTRSISQLTQGEVVSLDGKAVRRSFDSATGQAALHLVSAWAGKNRMVLAQRRVKDKSNEIGALVPLLEMLHLHGCIVTIDAMGCHKNIARKIVEKKAHYVLALKENHARLYGEVKHLFEWKARGEGAADELEQDYYESRAYGHGRQEVRRCWSIGDLSWLDETEEIEKGEWPGLASVALVESERRVRVKGELKTSVERRFFLSSLPGGVVGSAKRHLKVVRGHWGIENRLHWVLDVVFGEDASRVRRNNAPENLAILRKMALNLLCQETSEKAGVKGKRLKAGWDQEYLLQVLVGPEPTARAEQER